jgi:hypothetical protein
VSHTQPAKRHRGCGHWIVGFRRKRTFYVLFDSGEERVGELLDIRLIVGTEIV